MKDTKNKVAKILKIYAIVNAIVCMIASIWIGFDYDFIYFVVGAAISIVVNFAIYAFGEIIDLLDRIRQNTENSNGSKNNPNYNDLPDL